MKTKYIAILAIGFTIFAITIIASQFLQVYYLGEDTLYLIQSMMSDKEYLESSISDIKEHKKVLVLSIVLPLLGFIFCAACFIKTFKDGFSDFGDINRIGKLRRK